MKNDWEIIQSITISRKTSFMFRLFVVITIISRVDPDPRIPKAHGHDYNPI